MTARSASKHWRDFRGVAVVTDRAWMSAMVNRLKPFVRMAVRLFTLAGLPAARNWIAGAPECTRPRRQYPADHETLGHRSDKRNT